MPTPLATTEQLAAYLGAEPVNADQAAFALDAASGLVRSYCGWSITPDEDVTTWLVDGHGGELLTVPTLRLLTVTRVVVRGDPVDLAQITFSASGVLHRRYDRWPVGLSCVSVSGTHGYAPDEVPRELVAVVCSLASRWSAMAGQGPLSAYRVGGVQLVYARNSPGEAIGLNDTETAVLDRYRIANVR